jgi:hypothetical protein
MREPQKPSRVRPPGPCSKDITTGVTGRTMKLARYALSSIVVARVEYCNN